MLGLVAIAAIATSAIGPPSPVLQSGDDQLTAARGSSCWFADGQGVCVDTFPPTTKRSLSVRPGGRIRVDMRHRADSLSASLRGDQARRLRVHRVDESHFNITVPGGMKRKRVLDLFATYPEGDSFFGARLRIR
jgi:hypothetical protein